jgi:hypothetical protein
VVSGSTEATMESIVVQAAGCRSNRASRSPRFI